MCSGNTGHLRWCLQYIETDFAKLQKHQNIIMYENIN